MKLSKRRKAQLQIGENMIILVIFFFLLVFGVILYAKLQSSNLKMKKQEIQKLSLIDLKSVLISMPELKCVEGGDITDNCIDEINLKNLAAYWDSIENITTSPERGYYINKFGYITIQVKKFDPLTSNWTKTWNLYNLTYNSTNSQPTFMPVSLYNPIYNDYSFGVLTITSYYTSK